MSVKRTCCFLICWIVGPIAGALADTFGTGSNSFSIDFVTIGSPGNPPDLTGSPNPAGSVPYDYRMAKFEISREMVARANLSGKLGLKMTADEHVPGGARPEMAAGGISWYHAARFVNWLNTSQGFPAAYKFEFQPGQKGYDPNASNGLWVPTDPGFDPRNWLRNSGAHYFLPSADEWYKAAYYDPKLGSYWDYPTGSNLMPLGVASGTDPGTAVAGQPFEQGPSDINKAGGLSPYGVMGLGGNLFEWEETEVDLINDGTTNLRGARGGDWLLAPEYLIASFRSNGNSGANYPAFGIRVASVPEPAGGALWIYVLSITLGMRRFSGQLSPYSEPGARKWGRRCGRNSDRLSC